MTTNNHPAHGTVSLDRLHQIREILSKAAAQSDGGNLGYAMADAVKVIDGSISAFDAEPMAWRWFHLNQWHVTNDEERARDLAWDGVKVIPLYTAPPAPVVPDEMVNNIDNPYGDEDLIYETGKIDGWNACRAAILQAGNSPVTPDCSCRTCRPVTFTDSRFVVCHECGNKRCPHANDHRNACTGSNEPGQEGSAYPAEPQQEVKSALEHGMQRYAGAMQKLSEGDK